MGLQRLRNVQTGDRVQQQMQDNAKSSLDSLASNPFIKGQVLENVFVTSAAGGTRVPHKLGRKLEGWVVVRRRGAAVPYDAQDSEPSPDKFLALRTVNDVTVDIWVF